MITIFEWALCISCFIFLLGAGVYAIVEAVIRYREYKDLRKEKKKDTTSGGTK